jgi:hypothetical protein
MFRALGARAITPLGGLWSEIYEALAEVTRFGHELSAVEELRVVEIEAAATRRMLASEEPA